MRADSLPLLKPISIEETIELLEKGVSPNDNQNGRNALHQACEFTHRGKERVSLMLQYNADVNMQDKNAPYHNTPLHIVIANEATDHALHFIDKAKSKIDWGITDTQKKTTLILAAKTNNTQIVESILTAMSTNAKNYIDMQDANGMTAFHYACLYGNATMADLLLKHGANTSIKNNKEKLAIDCTVMNRNDVNDILKEVKINGDRDENAIWNAITDSLYQYPMSSSTYQSICIPAQSSFKEKIKEIIMTTPLIDPNSVATMKSVEDLRLMREEDKKFIVQLADNMTGVSLLERIMLNKPRLEMMLIEKGIASDWLLRFEAAQGNKDLVSGILKYGRVDVNAAGKPSLKTALHQAASKGHYETCEIILSNKADPTKKDCEGDTPLHLAILNKHYETAKILVKTGKCDLGIRNKAQQSPLDLLKVSQQSQFMQELIQIDLEAKSKMTDTTSTQSEKSAAIFN